MIGQDANYDLANYHWYNPYAFLHGRGDFDVAPAQVPTYYNPLLDVPFFLLAQHAPPMLCSFVLGALHGLNFVALYALARVVLPDWSAWARGGGGALIAALGVTGGGVFGLLGTTFYDNVLSLFFLAALWLVCNASYRGVLSARTFAAAGLLAGCAVGLKLPTAIYAFGLAVACLALPGKISVRIARASTFGVAGLAGVALSGGFWMLHLWRHFGNPIFPYFNNVIGSALALNENYRDVTFIPHSLLDAVFFPVEFTLNPYYVGEVGFTDLRILLLFVAALATLVTWRGVARAGQSSNVIAPPVRFALTMALASYVAWLCVFAIYRYLATLEMIAPLLTTVLIAAWPTSKRARVAVVFVCALILASSTRPSYWDRVSFGARFVEATVPAFPDNSAPMVLIAGDAPLSWVIPFFPERVPFVRVQGDTLDPRHRENGLLMALVRTRITEHRGSFYLLMRGDEQDVAAAVIATFGLSTDFVDCVPIEGTLANGARICPLRRNGDS